MGKYEGAARVALKPKTREQAAAVLRHCNERRLAVVPQAGQALLLLAAACPSHLRQPSPHTLALQLRHSDSVVLASCPHSPSCRAATRGSWGAACLSMMRWCSALRR